MHPQRDQHFKKKDCARFHCSKRRISCQKLAVDGKSKAQLLDSWKTHFETLDLNLPTVTQCHYG